MEEKKPTIIGHVTHGKTVLTAAITGMLYAQGRVTKGISDIPPEPTRRVSHIAAATEMVRGDFYTSKKQNKPNKGIVIGSYKFRSKKK